VWEVQAGAVLAERVRWRDRHLGAGGGKGGFWGCSMCVEYHPDASMGINAPSTHLERSPQDSMQLKGCREGPASPSVAQHTAPRQPAPPAAPRARARPSAPRRRNRRSAV